MKHSLHIFSLIICISMICPILCCCGENETRQTAACQEEDNLIEYSSNLHVSHYKSGYYIKITNPWKGGSLGEFYLYPDTLELPDELSTKQVIRTPVRSVVAYSSTQWSVFQRLGELERVKGILESNYTDDPQIKQLIADGKMSDVGTESKINIEKVIDIQPDVILYTPYPTIQDNKIGELTGAVMLPFADYLENHPLGRAEWLKIIGCLTCREKETDCWFNDIATNYKSIKSLCRNATDTPTVFSDLPFDGQWYVPGGRSYIAQIFCDAAADYVWKDNDATGSLPVDAETVLAKAGDADFWRIMNSTDTPYSYERLSVENELFTYYKAFKNRNVIVCDVRESAYFENAQYEPDVMLKDFATIFHPELFEDNYQPKYFHLLNE